MLEAWQELDPQLGANAWVVVKLMPYELARTVGWTPKDAFADIRHLDWPWQSNSKLRPQDAGSDVDDIDWDTVPPEFYGDGPTPDDVREALAKTQPLQPTVQPVDVEVHDSDSTITVASEHSDTPTSQPHTPPPRQVQTAPTGIAKFKRTSPGSRKPATIFKFQQPPKLPCTFVDCPNPTVETTSRCQSCSVPVHGNCLHDRVLCSACYNARMEHHKATMKEKAGSRKRTTPAPPAGGKKAKVASGMSRSKSMSTLGKRPPPPSEPALTFTFTPRKPPSDRNPLSRAEQRLLDLAIKASLQEEMDTNTPTKGTPQGKGSILSLYNPILQSQGRSVVTALDIDSLPASVHSDGFGVLGDEEIQTVKATIDAHHKFMRSKAQAPMIAHLLGPANIALVDGLVSNSDIRKCEINQNFRLFDLLGLLSYRFTTDSVLTCYMHHLSYLYPNVYFVNPLLYKYVEDYEKTSVRFDADWIHHDYLVWPLNLGNYHWVVAVMKTAPGSTIYFCDSMNGTDMEEAKASVPPNLHHIVSLLGHSVTPTRHWNSVIEVILVPRQQKKNNDCGCCVNELARAFAHDPEVFLSGEVNVNFESLSLRCTQAATLLKWLYHDVCS